MEVVSLTVPRRSDPTVTVGIPFNKRNVEEWSRLDRLTGMMEKAKIETDHWSARSTNAAHKYGKMVDSRERNNKDGTIHESQRKQMEVFQTQVPGGSMQVIRTQTVTTSSKSSKWVSTDKMFSDLQLPVNSLDLSSQKSKGSVGRSGSIGGRRPPSRPRSLIGQSANSASGLFGEDSSVSKLCHQIHERAKSEMFKPRMNGFGGTSELDSDGSNVVITEVTEDKGSGLYRRKSCSNENVAASGDGSDEDSLKRSSKVRRSLQFPKTHAESEELEWCGGKSLKERAAEIENLLKRGGGTVTSSAGGQEGEKEAEKAKPVKRRDSFVSADTLKEVRERLKKSNPDLKDDGIVSDSKVKCFVHGMESMTKSSINGTGSLESRSSCRGSVNGARSAEWYRRRKSYGFEDVEEQDKFGKFNRRTNIESSTDSGICQSSETVGTPSWSGKDAFRGSPVPTVVTVGARKETKTYHSYNKADEKSVNSVYLDNPTVIRVEDTKYNDPYGYNSPWNRKSPISHPKTDEVRESLKSTLCSAKNPWISQLKGTKLVDRNWAADEQDASEESKTALRKDSDADNTQKKSKKVEFCKTEVHFAAESGKFNIVETDGKPPPNDIFRRRRRNLAAAVPKNLSGLPETKFGDSVYEKRLLTSDKTESISEKIEAELKELSQIVIDALPQQEDPTPEYKKPVARLYDVLEEDGEDVRNGSLRPRSILKNNGPSFKQEVGPHGRPGGSPIPPATQVWKSTVVLRNKRYDNVRKQGDDVKLYSSDGENELQVRIRNLRKTDPKWWESGSSSVSAEVKRRSLPDDILLKQVDGAGEIGSRVVGEEVPSLSVAERVRKVEELKSMNYSSKINFRSGEMTVVQNGSESQARDEARRSRIWAKAADSLAKERPTISCVSIFRQPPTVNHPMTEIAITDHHRPNRTDTKTSSNPSVMRFSTNKDDKTDSQKYQTTRILINFQSSSHQQEQRQGDKPQTTTTTTATTTTMTTTSTSTSLSASTTTAASEKQPQPLKTGSLNSHKAQSRQVNSYGSWSPGMRKDLNRYFNDLRSTSLVRETIHGEDIPKPSKTVHEIIDQFDSLSRRNNLRERRRKTMPINYKAPKEYTQADLEEELKNFTENLDKDFRDIYEEEIGSVRRRSQKKEKLIQPVIVKNPPKTYASVRSSSDVSSQKTSSKLNYDSDDSDLLADEEVRSYMSTGLVGTDSDAEDAHGSGKSFEDSGVQCEKVHRRKEIKNEIRPVKVPPYTEKTEKEERKIASIALKYEDDPLFAGRSRKPTAVTATTTAAAKPPTMNGFKEDSDRWEKTSNSSSTNSAKRERSSYLNVLSLSEIYSKYFERSSNSSLDQIPEVNRSKLLPESRSGFRQPSREPKAEEERKPTKTVARSYREEVSASRQRVRQSETVASSIRSRSLAERKRLPAERKKPKDKPESVILDELTRAADQILVAVNDYDDDSHLASSEDDDKGRRVIRKSKVGNLGTISEGKRVTKTETRRTSTVAAAAAKRNATGTQSSASSLESLSRESIRGRSCTKTRQSERVESQTTKPLSSRATRLLQRANTRQASMPQPSSSEDLPSYIELAKKRSLRRQRSSASVKSNEGSQEGKPSRTKLRSKTAESSSVSRTRDKKADKAKESTTASKSVKTSVKTSRTTVESERSKSSGRRVGTEKLGERRSRRKRSSKASGMSCYATPINSFDRVQRRAQKKSTAPLISKSRLSSVYRTAKKKTFRKMETVTSCSECLRCDEGPTKEASFIFVKGS